jgi:aminoglycoside phosphotransferase (APT) family kinase protein
MSLEEGEALHAALEGRLEAGTAEPQLERAYRLLGWRILAAKGGSGLTGRIAELAREAETLEEYEAARERALGPILEGLERGENRDP